MKDMDDNNRLTLLLVLQVQTLHGLAVVQMAVELETVVTRQHLLETAIGQDQRIAGVWHLPYLQYGPATDNPHQALPPRLPRRYTRQLTHGSGCCRLGCNFLKLTAQDLVHHQPTDEAGPEPFGKEVHEPIAAQTPVLQSSAQFRLREMRGRSDQDVRGSFGHLRRDEYLLLVDTKDDSKQTQECGALLLKLLGNMRCSDSQ